MEMIEFPNQTILVFSELPDNNFLDENSYK